MRRTNIWDLQVDEKDLSGDIVNRIFDRSPPRYAVYLADNRIKVQFHDDPGEAAKQHEALAPLAPMRSQIDGLIAAWRSEDVSSGWWWRFGRGDAQKRAEAKADRFTERTAKAIVPALEQRSEDSMDLLREIREDIITARRSTGASDYLVTAAAFALFWIFVFGLLTAQWFPHIRAFPDGTNALWTGASGGTIGAFFSIATGLRNRTVLPDLQAADNRRDAMLRILVGTIGGAVLILLFRTGLVTLGTLSAEKVTLGTPGYSDLTVALLGFIAGFTERAVPDLLAKSNLSLAGGQTGGDATSKDKAGNVPVTPQPTPVPAGAATADEPPPPTEIDAEDTCLAHQPITEDEATDDADLPTGSGGIVQNQEA